MVLQKSLSLSITKGAIWLFSSSPAEGIPTFISLPYKNVFSHPTENQFKQLNWQAVIYWSGHSLSGLTQWSKTSRVPKLKRNGSPGQGGSKGSRITPLSSSDVLRETPLHCKMTPSKQHIWDDRHQPGDFWDFKNHNLSLFLEKNSYLKHSL